MQASGRRELKMQAAGRRGGAAKPKKKAPDEEPPAAPSGAAPAGGSDGGGSSGGGGAGGDGAAGVDPEPRAPSAGPNLREMAFRVLSLCQKGEYPAVDQLLKNIDKLHQSSPLEDGQLPLAGVSDPVSIRKFYLLWNFPFYKQAPWLVYTLQV